MYLTSISNKILTNITYSFNNYIVKYKLLVNISIKLTKKLGNNQLKKNIALQDRKRV